MMNGVLSVAFSCCLLTASAGLAAELTSGPKTGEVLGAFEVVKCGGALSDGVEPGDELDYRCKYPRNPQVIVFASKTDRLADLVAQLDAAMQKNDELHVFVAFLGDDGAALRAAAKQFATKEKVRSVAIVVPKEHEKGPPAYRLNPKADLTVLLAKRGKLVASHCGADKDLDRSFVDGVMADVKNLLQ